MDEGNQRLLSTTVLLEEEKELDNEKLENKRNGYKGLILNWKKKKKKKKRRRRRRRRRTKTKRSLMS